MSTSVHKQAPLLKKSRSGCRDCRRRKVKCDEAKPVCGNCRRRYVNIQRCDWGSNTTRNVRCSEDQSVPDVNAQSLSLHPSSVTSNSQWRSLELRLMHHYTAVVSSTMPSCNGAPTEAWQQTIPQLSFSSEIVLNPMLALSALHLHSHSPNDMDAAVAMHRYFGRALTHHRHALSGSGDSLSEQLWLSAVVLCHMCWLFAHRPQPNIAYELPLQAFMMLKGIDALFVQKNVQSYGSLGNEAPPDVLPNEYLSIAATAQLRAIEEDLSHLFDKFDVLGMSEEARKIYTEAKNYVLYHFRAFYSGADSKTLQRFVAYMAVRCPTGYHDMLQRHDPLAMALMARMVVLLSELDYAWWANGNGEYEVVGRDIRGICQLMPKSLLWTMDWPCMVLDKKVVLCRD